MKAEEFCKVYDSFFGEETTDVKQIAYHEFTGEELKEFVDYCSSLQIKDLIEEIKKLDIYYNTGKSTIRKVQVLEILNSKLK